ncbi:hypothetical protein G9P44_003422 [Scheffersomyces stipitis]|nr:hypothetical protein G9P44_003422 [Scheffersomyces stipitis]
MTVETIIQYLSCWQLYVLAVLVYHIFNWIHEQILYKKFGASPCINNERGGFLGIRLLRTLLKAKSDGTLSDVVKNRYYEMEHPEIETFTSRVFSQTVIATRDPANLKAILATQFNDFSLGIRHAQLYPLLGDGIFTLDGEGWKHSRAMLRPQFAKEQIAHVQSLEPHIQVLAKHIRKSEGKSFEMQELFFRLTLDCATEFLFGESVESLRDASIGMARAVVEVEGKDRFAEAFNLAQTQIATRSMMNKMYFLYNTEELRNSCDVVHRFTDYYVNLALRTSTAELDKKSKSGYTFLYELVKQTRNPQILRDQLLNILLAGRDTTAGLLSFAFFELARQPHIWAKLKDEIYSAFGSGENSRIDEITFESLKRCEYLKAVLNETLRMYPSVPNNGRIAVRNTTLPRGGGPTGTEPMLVRKGQKVVYSVYTTHRSKTHYGEDAEVFRPERWFEPSSRKLGWAYLPFNGGPRICLGQQFALTEASYVVTRLIQMFPNISSDPTIEYPPRKASQLTMCLQDGLLISLY